MFAALYKLDVSTCLAKVFSSALSVLSLSSYLDLSAKMNASLKTVVKNAGDNAIDLFMRAGGIWLGLLVESGTDALSRNDWVAGITP